MKDIFKLVKANITTRQAAEYYGLNVQRNGMTLCPFHNDHAPSLKVDTRFYCFGCQVKGDVIDFVSKLFGLSLIQAAQKLAADFGLDPNTPQSAAVVPAQPPVVQQRRLVLECTKALTDYERLLNHWKTAYAPADMNAPWDGRFAQALHELPVIGHVLDLLYSAKHRSRNLELAKNRRYAPSCNVFLLQPYKPLSAWSQQRIVPLRHPFPWQSSCAVPHTGLTFSSCGH